MLHEDLHTSLVYVRPAQLSPACAQGQNGEADAALHSAQACPERAFQPACAVSQKRGKVG